MSKDSKHEWINWQGMQNFGLPICTANVSALSNNAKTRG